MTPAAALVPLSGALLAVSSAQGLAVVPALALGALVPWLLFTSRPRAALGTLLLALLAGNYAWWIASLAWSGNLARLVADAAFARWQLRGLVVFLPLAAWLAAGRTIGERERGTLLMLLVVPAALVAAAGLALFAAGAAPTLGTDLETSFAPVRRVHGDLWFFGLHRSHLAAGGFALTIALVLVAALGTTRPARARLVALAVALVLVLWALAMAKSRASLLAFWAGCGLLALVGLAPRLRARPLAAWAAAAVAFTAAVSFASPDARDRLLAIAAPAPAASSSPKSDEAAALEAMRQPDGDLTAAIASANVSDRRVYWRAALDLVRAHPATGIGLGNFPDAFAAGPYRLAIPPTRPEMAHAHNVALQFAAETGLVGLALFASFWLLLLLALARAARAAPAAGTARALALGALAGSLAQSLAGIVDLTLWSPSIMLPLMTLAGLALAGPVESAPASA
jgi:O-antigen ligase